MIRFATIDDVDDIMEFINTHWKKGHILATNKDFFLYELGNVDDKSQINMAIARDDKTNKLLGIDGIYYYGKRKEGRDTSGCMWKVIKSDNPVLGIDLFEFVLQHTRTRCNLGAGLGKMAIPIHKYLKFKTGVMTHWYRLNPNIQDFQIASVTNLKIPKTKQNSSIKLVKFKTFDELKQRFDFIAYYNSEMRPTKEDWYIQKRYFNHPIYKYEIYGVEIDSSIKTLAIFRIQTHENSQVLRFVDVVGNFDDIYHITHELDSLLIGLKCEYIDFYEYGMDSEKMKEAGWLQTKSSGNVIPNYFKPFVAENIDIHYATQEPNYRIFKADGDQDRPS